MGAGLIHAVKKKEMATFITSSFVLTHRSVTDRLSSNATVSTGRRDSRRVECGGCPILRG